MMHSLLPLSELPQLSAATDPPQLVGATVGSTDSYHAAQTAEWSVAAESVDQCVGAADPRLLAEAVQLLPVLEACLALHRRAQLQAYDLAGLFVLALLSIRRKRGWCAGALPVSVHHPVPAFATNTNTNTLVNSNGADSSAGQRQQSNSTSDNSVGVSAASPVLSVLLHTVPDIETVMDFSYLHQQLGKARKQRQRHLQTQKDCCASCCAKSCTEQQVSLEPSNGGNQSGTSVGYSCPHSVRCNPSLLHFQGYAIPSVHSNSANGDKVNPDRNYGSNRNCNCSCNCICEALCGGVTVMEVFHTLRLSNIKHNGDNYINRSLVCWAQGLRDFVLLHHIPSPMTVLTQQACGKRVVTLFTTLHNLARSHCSPLTYMAGMQNHARDPLEFLLHDLKHMENFADPSIRAEQVLVRPESVVLWRKSLLRAFVYPQLDSSCSSEAHCYYCPSSWVSYCSNCAKEWRSSLY